MYIDEVDGVPLDVDGVPLAKDVDGEPLADPEEEEDEDIFNMSPKKRYILLIVVSCSNLVISLYPTSYFIKSHFIWSHKVSSNKTEIEFLKSDIQINPRTPC